MRSKSLVCNDLKKGGVAMRNILLSLLACGTSIAFSLFLEPCSAVAQTAHTHDGFFLRLATGVGSSKSTEDVDGTEIAWKGTASQGSVAIGFAVRPNFIVNLDIFGNMVTDPTLSIDGVELGDAKGLEVSGDGIGVGITYYLMPVNIYVAGSFGFGYYKAKFEGHESETDPGYAANFMVGKEWWIAEEWGIGIAGQVFWSSVPTKDENRTYTLNTLSIGLLFSATYN